MPGGKAVAVDITNRLSTLRRTAEDKTGAWGPNSVTP